MPRLSIEISAQEHQHLKAVAALKGLSIKDYVLSLTHADITGGKEMSEAEAFAALRDLLAKRMEQIKAGKYSVVSAAEIGRRARSRLSQ